MAHKAPGALKDLRKPVAAATDPHQDARFALKAALKRAGTIRREATAHFDDLRLVIERLERRGERPSE